MTTDSKPKLLWLRFLRPNLPSFVQLHMREQEACMAQFFDLTVVNEPSCDFQQLCDAHEPDLAIFETGVYTGRAEITKVNYSPQIPRLGFIHCDAYCRTRKTALANMARWGVSTYFGISVSMAEYTPSIADDLFVWPNFVNLDLYRDYGLTKVLPILFTGSQASHYPWRSRIDRMVSRCYPSLHSPHFGWGWRKQKPSTSGFLQGERYAQLINSSYIAPTCGTIANEVVRKHFEIPACNTCLLTEKTAGLEAAGFEDMINCVFATEDDVLDKIEWLFENPDELRQITARGKELVDARHSINQRNQVLDWFTLRQHLQPGQRIVQPSPFEPMRIVEAQSAATHGHVPARGVDRTLLAAGDQQIREGNDEEAEKLYRRCLNYHQPPIPDHMFRLIRCQLHQGKSREALATLREHFPSHRTSSAHGFEPDPAEWAWFLLALLCHGKRREAALRAEQFPQVRSRELDWARSVVAAACRRSTSANSHGDASSYRHSVHQMPGSTEAEWMVSLRRMLDACGQQAIAETVAKLPNAPPKLMEPEVKSAGSLQQQRLLQDARVDPVTADSRGRARLADAVLHYSLNASSRLTRLGGKAKDRTQRLLRQTRKALSAEAPCLPDDEIAGLVGLLKKEEIAFAVLLGATRGSWLSDAFMSGMMANPQMPSVTCINRSCSQFASFHRQYADTPGVEFRYLARGCRATLRPEESAGLVVLEQPELLEQEDAMKVIQGAQLVLVSQLLTSAGNACYRSLSTGKTHHLVMHEPSHQHGFALFRRDPDAQGSASPSWHRVA
jgi:hypothetical protein